MDINKTDIFISNVESEDGIDDLGDILIEFKINKTVVDDNIEFIGIKNNFDKQYIYLTN